MIIYNKKATTPTKSFIPSYTFNEESTGKRPLTTANKTFLKSLGYKIKQK